jgi:hypothetical protein
METKDNTGGSVSNPDLPNAKQACQPVHVLKEETMEAA